MVSLRWLVFLLLSAPLPLYCDRVPKESLYCKTWPDCVSDPHHTLFECLSWTKLKLQNNISPCHQGTYISAFQYDWHSCVSRTFLHGAHSSIAFLSFSFSLSVVEPSFNESMSHAWFLLLWTGHTGRHNGILLWWTQLRAHRPRGAVPPECSPWDGQVRASKQRGFILMSAALWLTVGVCVGVYRYLIQGLDWIDARYAGMSSWDQRLPPPAAKTAVQTLTVIVITAEQAGRQKHEN